MVTIWFILYDNMYVHVQALWMVFEILSGTVWISFSWWVVMYSNVIVVLSVYVILIVLCLIRYKLWLTETDISYVRYLTEMNNKPNRAKLNFGTAPVDDISIVTCSECHCCCIAHGDMIPFKIFRFTPF